MIEMRLYLAKKILILVSSFSPPVGAVVKEKALVCKQVDCECLLPSFGRQCELRNMPCT
jgi:hypothetical protein